MHSNSAALPTRLNICDSILITQFWPHAKDLGPKAKVKDRGHVAKAETFGYQGQGQRLGSQIQGLEMSRLIAKKQN